MSIAGRPETYFKYNSIVIDTIKEGFDKNREETAVDAYFTGERFVSGISDKQLSMEYYQRYYSVLSLVKGNNVLDAACGEGYGTVLLSAGASHVIGVDTSTDAGLRANCHTIIYLHSQTFPFWA